MKFKIKKGTKLFTILDEVGDKMNAARKAAGKLAKEYGFEQWHGKSFVLEGGISAFHAKKKPEGYTLAYGSKEPEAVFPKKIKVNKELLDKINALPVVEHQELNEPLKYDGFKSTKFSSTGGRYISFHPGIVFRKNVILVSIPEHIKYKPVKDMTEITCSEFEKLRKQK